MTEHEAKIWRLLRAKRFVGYKFRRQHRIGKYIADFACKEKFIIIECDGSQHNRINNMAADKERDFIFAEEGLQNIKVLEYGY